MLALLRAAQEVALQTLRPLWGWLSLFPGRGLNSYPPAEGSPRARNAIADRLARFPVQLACKLLF